VLFQSILFLIVLFFLCLLLLLVCFVLFCLFLGLVDFLIDLFYIEKDCSWCRKCVILLFTLVSRLEDLERAHQRVVHGHHGSGVVELAAIVGRREEGDQLALGKELVPILHDLMGSADEIELVLLQELGHHLGSEGEADAAVVLAPAHGVLVGIGPEQIAQQSLVGHVGGAHDATDLLHGGQIGTEAAVAAENLLIDNGRHRQAVEAVREGLPQLDAVATLALVVESVYAIDAGALVVAAQQEEVLRVFDLVGEQQADGLQRLLAAVDVVAQEEVVRLRRKAAVLEQTQQIVVLAVDVAADLERGLQLEQNGLREEYLARLEAQGPDLAFREGRFQK